MAAQGKVRVYLEVASRRTFAAALDWPGWARSGREPQAALAALAEYGARYARAVRPARLGFATPGGASSFIIIERLKGDATTDFGAPGAIPALDGEPLLGKDVERQVALLRAAWAALDGAVAAAGGKGLSTGPRGGGRGLTQIVQHALDADQAYLRSLGWKVTDLPDNPLKAMARLRLEVEAAVVASTRGEIAPIGPRGGRRWSARTFIRRAAWHALDHAWEIEDRVLPVRARSPKR